MATMLFVLLISFMTVLVYGLPMQIAPPKRIVEKLKNTGVNPEERGGGIEGDMLIPGFNRKSQFRGAAVLTQHKWPNNVIPYDITAISDPKNRAMIENAMDILMYDTGTPIADSTSRYDCVYFRPCEPTDQNFLTIQYGTGCNAHVGYWPGFKVTLTLEKEDCFHSGTIQHELMHVLGFEHEQSRVDRDKFIEVKLENVEEDLEFAFEILPRNDWTNLNTEYDYSSIMHYGTHYFSKNGHPTIVPKQKNVQIGNRDNLSSIDIAEVRRFYGCIP